MTSTKYASQLAKLRSYALRGPVKQADDATGAGMEVPFEQALSDLTHAYLADKAPSLQKYEVGFQLIDKSDDNTRAIGVTGYKVGPQILMVPCIFNNGQLEGSDILYIKNQDLCVPLSENWLNYLLHKQPHILGEPTTRNLHQLGVAAPNLFQIKYPPNKYASEQARTPMAKWAADLLPPLCRMLTFDPAKDPPKQDLPSFLKKAGRSACRALVRAVRDWPVLMDGIDKFYGREKIAEAMREAAAEEDKRTSVLSKQAQTQQTKPTTGSVLHPTQPAETQKAGGVRIIQMSSFFGAPSVLPIEEADREQVLQGKVVMKDTREEGTTTQVFEVDQGRTLSNPDGSGIFDVLVSPCEFARCAVFYGPYNARGRSQTTCLVVRLDNKAWVSIAPSMVWTRNPGSVEDLRKFVDGLPDADDMGEGLQMLVSPSCLSASYPFFPKEESESGGFCVYRAMFLDSAERIQGGSRHFDYTRYETDPLLQKWNYRLSQRVVLTGARGMKFRVTPGELQCPKGTKVLKLDQKTCGCGTDSDPAPLLTLGSLPDFHMGILQTAGEPVSVRFGGDDYWVGEKKAMKHTDALIHLVVDQGLREKAARELLDRAKKEGRVDVFFKRADPRLTDGQANAPPFPPEPSPAVDTNMYSNVPVQPSYEFQIPSQDTMARDTTDRSVYNPLDVPRHFAINDEPYQSAVDVAQDAAQSGQKEVFDTSMIAALMRNTSPDTAVSENIGSMMQTTSRLGKLLMNVCWNREAYAERYGKEELPSIKDKLKDTFKNLGDLVLTLKEKTAQPENQAGILPDSDEGSENL